MMMALLQDASFWYLISFVIFVVIAYIKGRDVVKKAITERIETIKEEVEEAQNLREEANQILKQAKREQTKALKQCDKIIDNAKQQARSLKKEAEQQLKEQLANQEKAAFSRFQQMEEQMAHEMRIRAGEMAIKLAEEYMRDQMAQTKNHSQYVDWQLKNLRDGG